MSGNWAFLNYSVSVSSTPGKSVWVCIPRDGQSFFYSTSVTYMLTPLLWLWDFSGYTFTFVSWVMPSTTRYGMNAPCFYQWKSRHLHSYMLYKKEEKGSMIMPSSCGQSPFNELTCKMISYLIPGVISLNIQTWNPAYHRWNAMKGTFTTIIISCK